MGTSVHQIGHFFIIFFTFEVAELCICSGSNNIGVCKEGEKQALLCFKKESEDPMNRLSSWVDGLDCCSKWEGVVCDNITGHVIELQLAGNPEFDDEYFSSLKGEGKLSSCLLELKQLHHLDLSGLYNYFSGSRIPNFIGSLVNLKYLDLSYTGFRGIIPHQLGNLSSLHTLHLGYGDLKVDSLDWISSLSNLQLLELTYANLSMAHNWAELINMLPSLHELHLIGCELPKLSHPVRHNNSALLVLDLSGNEFNSIILTWIFNLNKLVSLDLSYCGFLSPFLDGLWNLTSLSILDISDNNLNGSLPSQLFSLSNLVSLNIGWNQFQNPLPSGLQNLTSLKNLEATGNPLNSQIPNLIYNCTNLKSLLLENTQMQGTISNSISNLTFLYYLDLSENKLTGEIPKQIGKLSKLRELYLYGNMLTGEIPKQIGKLSKLQDLDLSTNMLTGEMPKQIGKLSKLRGLYLSGNMLTGEMPKQIGKLSKLQYLDLSGNKFYRLFPEILAHQIGKLSKLQNLDISRNEFYGPVPEILEQQIGKLSKLQTLDISGNKLYGPLPESLGYLFPRMENLYIYNNTLEGIVIENHFVNLAKLRSLRASRNRLTLNVNPNWTPPFQVEILDLSGWNLGPQFPTWLHSQHQILHVDISNAGIDAEVPTWFWNFSSQIRRVNLSHNQLQGKIQNISFHQSPEYEIIPLSVYLGSNQFSGPLPLISVHISELDLSNNSFSGDVSGFLCHAQNVPYKLKILHLGGNDLSGEIPDCWMHWPHLKVINMRENKLIGSIPNSIGLLNQLRSLDLHRNMFSGNIPSSLHNCTLLLKVDLGENGFTGKIPRWLGSTLSNLTILRLRSNEFNGELPLEFCYLTSLHILDLANNSFFGVIPRCLNNLSTMINQKKEIEDEYYDMKYSSYLGAFEESALVTTKGHEYTYGTNILVLFAGMDLSSNNFSGEIPIELTNLVGLRSLNLSRNNLTGNIPKEMGNMKQLESLDLSRNHLSGKVPSSFSSLYGLSVLDLSYNNLVGKIPSGTQLQGFNASCYIGNNLCGLPLSQNCSVDDGEILKHENKGDDGFEVDWFYVIMAIGFAMGFLGICGSLFLVRSWRIAYFHFLDKRLNSFFAWAHALRFGASSVLNY